jgi:hypothetical protein
MSCSISGSLQDCKVSDFNHELFTCRRRSLKSLLNEYKMFPGLGVHLVFVGANGRKDRPAEGGVLSHYNLCSGPRPDPQVRTIANTYFVQQSTGRGHNFIYRCGHSHCLPEKLKGWFLLEILHNLCPP